MTENRKQKIYEALKRWVWGESYDEMVKYGYRLDKFSRFLPEECKTSPTSTLYRGILVEKTLLNKVSMGRKPLVLRNRLYSSWTYNPEVAKRHSAYFLEKKIRHGDEKWAAVLLKRVFSESEIMLSVPETAKAVGWNRGSALEEQEIIIKNIKKDFRFKPNEIALYLTEPADRWRPPDS